MNNPWLFGGLAAGAVGLGCIYLVRKWMVGSVGVGVATVSPTH